VAKLLIVVDYQNDFVDGSLGFDGAETLAAPIAERIRSYRDDGDTVAFTYDTHGDGYADTIEGRFLPVAHCTRGTRGWELFGEVAGAVRSGDPVFVKDTFGSADLFDYLRRESFDSIELCGLVSNICVAANAVLAKTAAPDTPIIVDAALTASYDAALGEKALDVLAGLHISVIRGGGGR
jgi:nicotinamidase-related amidase